MEQSHSFLEPEPLGGLPARHGQLFALLNQEATAAKLTAPRVRRREQPLSDKVAADFLSAALASFDRP